jgi:hypothetical protein
MSGVAWVALACGLSLCGTARADPMRPWTAPAQGPQTQTAPGPQGAGGAVTRGAASDAASAPGRGGPGTARTAHWNAAGAVDLVAIREDSEGRRQALIGEAWLKPGDRFTDALGPGTLAFIGPQHVETLRGRERTRTDLLPPLQPAPQGAPTSAERNLTKPSRASALATPGAQRQAPTSPPTATPPDGSRPGSASPGPVAPTQIRLNPGKKSP